MQDHTDGRELEFVKFDYLRGCILSPRFIFQVKFSGLYFSPFFSTIECKLTAISLPYIQPHFNTLIIYFYTNFELRQSSPFH